MRFGFFTRIQEEEIKSVEVSSNTALATLIKNKYPIAFVAMSIAEMEQMLEFLEYTNAGGIFYQVLVCGIPIGFSDAKF